MIIIRGGDSAAPLESGAAPTFTGEVWAQPVLPGTDGVR